MCNFILRFQEIFTINNYQLFNIFEVIDCYFIIILTTPFFRKKIYRVRIQSRFSTNLSTDKYNKNIQYEI